MPLLLWFALLTPHPLLENPLRVPIPPRSVGSTGISAEFRQALEGLNDELFETRERARAALIALGPAYEQDWRKAIDDPDTTLDQRATLLGVHQAWFRGYAMSWEEAAQRLHEQLQHCRFPRTARYLGELLSRLHQGSSCFGRSSPARHELRRASDRKWARIECEVTSDGQRILRVPRPQEPERCSVGLPTGTELPNGADPARLAAISIEPHAVAWRLPIGPFPILGAVSGPRGGRIPKTYRGAIAGILHEALGATVPAETLARLVGRDRAFTFGEAIGFRRKP